MHDVETDRGFHLADILRDARGRGFLWGKNSQSPRG